MASVLYELMIIYSNINITANVQSWHYNQELSSNNPLVLKESIQHHTVSINEDSTLINNFRTVLTNLLPWLIPLSIDITHFGLAKTFGKNTDHLGRLISFKIHQVKLFSMGLILFRTLWKRLLLVREWWILHSPVIETLGFKGLFC